MKTLTHPNFHTPGSTIRIGEVYIYREFDRAKNINCEYIAKIEKIEQSKDMTFVTLKIEKILKMDSECKQEHETFILVITKNKINDIWLIKTP